MIPFPTMTFIEKPMKCKCTYNDRKQNNGGGRWKGKITTWHEGIFGNDAYVNFLDCSKVFMGIYIC